MFGRSELCASPTDCLFCHFVLYCASQQIRVLKEAPQASFHTFSNVCLSVHPIRSVEHKQVENCNSVSFHLVHYSELSFLCGSSSYWTLIGAVVYCIFGCPFTWTPRHDDAVELELGFRWWWNFDYMVQNGALCLSSNNGANVFICPTHHFICRQTVYPFCGCASWWKETAMMWSLWEKCMTGGSKLSAVKTFGACHLALDRWVCLYCVMTHCMRVVTGTAMEMSFMLCVTNSLWFVQFTITWNWTPECPTIILNTLCIFANFIFTLILLLYMMHWSHHPCFDPTNNICQWPEKDYSFLVYRQCFSSLNEQFEEKLHFDDKPWFLFRILCFIFATFVCFLLILAHLNM
jgi:hypothetical protein